MNGDPTVPDAVLALVIEGTGTDTVIARLAVPVPPEFEAEIVTDVVPVTPGVPLIKPEEAFNVRPDGRLLLGTPKLVGEFVPAIV